VRTPAVGASGEFRHRVGADRTVPRLLPDAPEFATMPEVLATGYLVGIVEWACIRMLDAYLAPDDLTLGTHVDLSHEAPTVPGETLMVRSELTGFDGRRFTFAIEVRDDHGLVSRGTHERIVVNRERFGQRIATRSPA
jgi:fluoroacetyl-CoA thioesterase